MKLTSACRAPNPFQAARHKPQGVPAARVHVVCQAGDAPAPQRPPTGPRPGPPSAGGGVRPAVSAIRPGPPGARPGTAVPLGPDGKPLEVSTCPPLDRLLDLRLPYSVERVHTCMTNL